MKTKLLALLFLVGSAAFAGPRVVVGVGFGGVGIGVGGPRLRLLRSAPAGRCLCCAALLPWLPRRILTSWRGGYWVRTALITARVGLRRVITAIATIAAGGGKSGGRPASLEGILQ